MQFDLPGLFSCGEGARYAGGILSAAMDGERVALAVELRIEMGFADIKLLSLTTE